MLLLTERGQEGMEQQATSPEHLRAELTGV